MVRKPFIDQLRRRVPASNGEVPRVVSVTDKGVSTIGYFKDPEVQRTHAHQRQIDVSIGAGATANRQVPDQHVFFKRKAALAAVTVVKDAPAKHVMQDILRTLDLHQHDKGRELRLPAAKKESIAAFVGGFDAMMTRGKALDPEEAVKAAVRCGDLDEATRTGPCWERIVSARRQQTTLEEEQRMLKALPVALKDVVQTGRCCDKNMHCDGDGPPFDFYSNGEVATNDRPVTDIKIWRHHVYSNTQLLLDLATQGDRLEMQRSAKAAREAAAMKKILDSNSAAEGKLRPLLNLPSSTSWSRRKLGQCKIEHFATLKKGELVAFLHSRTSATKKPTRDVDANKGTLAGAKAGEDDLIVRAAAVANMGLLLKPPVAYQPAAPPPPPAASLRNVASFPGSPARFGSLSKESAAERFKLRGWIERFRKACVVGQATSTLETEARAAVAALLAKLLLVRLERHVARRAKDCPKSTSWVWTFFCDNVMRLAAAMVELSLQAEDLSSARAGDCLLQSPSDSMVLAAAAGDGVCGAYVHHHAARGTVPRAGKSYPTPIIERGRQHLADAKKGTGGLFAGAHCPARDSAVGQDDNDDRRGYHEDLTLYVGLGFDPADGAAVTQHSRLATGLWVWSDATIERMRGLSFNGAATDAEKRLHMVSYMFELALDLSLGGCNVSEMPGFEACGLFNKNTRYC